MEIIDNNQQNLGQTRQRIDDLLNMPNFKRAGSLPGYSLIEYPKGFKGMNCLEYVLRANPDKNPYTLMTEIIETWNEVEKVEPGDLVLYFNSRNDWTHIGVALDDNKTVLSKFGKAPVYKHPMKMVPISYGDQIKFFRKPVGSDIIIQDAN